MSLRRILFSISLGFIVGCNNHMKSDNYDGSYYFIDGQGTYNELYIKSNQVFIRYSNGILVHFDSTIFEFPNLTIKPSMDRVDVDQKLIINNSTGLVNKLNPISDLYKVDDEDNNESKNYKQFKLNKEIFEIKNFVDSIDIKDILVKKTRMAPPGKNQDVLE